MRLKPKSRIREPYPSALQNVLMNGLILAVASLCFLPAMVLNLFIPYSLTGGSPIFKIHIGSYIIMLAFVYLMLSRGIVSVIVEQFQKQFLYTQFAGVVLIIAMIMTYSQGTSGLAYLIDTLFIPPLALMLAYYLTNEQRYRLTQGLVLFVFINAMVAISERVLSTNFYPMPWTFGGTFRASAFLGHPLNNALITTGFVFIIAALPFRFIHKCIIIGACCLAILTFGARGALAIVVLIGVASILAVGFQLLLQKRLQFVVVVVAPWLAVFMTLVAVGVVLFTNFAERIIEKLEFDDSAQERLDAFMLFDLMSWDQVLWGIKFQNMLTMIERHPDIEIIENFWIVLLVMLGLVLFIPFVISFIFYLFSLAKGKTLVLYSAILAFAVAASVNNSLATKTPALLLFSLALYGVPKQKRKRSKPEHAMIFMPPERQFIAAR
ncbi:MAG: VpsF family polysaccharide biosynthesis protein [Pseudomonadota bacterium]